MHQQLQQELTTSTYIYTQVYRYVSSLSEKELLVDRALSTVASEVAFTYITPSMGFSGSVGTVGFKT